MNSTSPATPKKQTSQVAGPSGSNSCTALYGSTLDKVLQYGVGRGYYPQSDVGAIKNRINQMAAKYQFSPDDFALFTLIESDGMAPRAGADQVGFNANCIGIIQFCSFGGLGNINKSRAEVASTSTLNQLDFVDTYFEKNNLPKGASLEDLYLTVLNPASVDIKDPNANLGIGGKQADILYASSGVITRNSIKSGLVKLGQERLACLPTPSNGSGGVLAGGPAPVQAGGIGTDSAILSGENCPPPPFNQRDRICYPGCKTKIASAIKGGSGFGYAANGVAYQGSPTSSTNGLTPYTGPLRPGAFIIPMKGALITSPYGFRWGRLHAGIDFAGPIGTTLYAVADGTVDSFTGINHPDAGGYGNIITLNHAGGVITRYGHVNSITVKVGEQIKQGQIIGTSGNAGRSTGPHLHFEIRPGGSPTDPTQFYRENLSVGATT